MARYILAILGLLLLIGGLAGIKATQISQLMDAGKAFAKAGPPPESVSTDFARELEWEGVLSAVGSVAAARGVALSNDAPGVVKRIHFESGAVIKTGQILVELDTGVERAQLATAQARKELAERTVARSRGLFTTNVISQSVLDADESQLKAVSAEVEALQAQIDRKVVRAPFAGRLGIRAVNLGQYLSPGTTLTTLEALDSVYVDFTLPQHALASVAPGSVVRVTVEGGEQAARHTKGEAAAAAPFATEGVVAAIDPALDAATRSIRVRASVPNDAQKLRPGMFANVSVVLPKRARLVVVPATAIVHAPYGDSLFVVEASTEPAAKSEGASSAASAKSEPAAAPVKQVRQQFVRLGEERGDFVAVLDGVSAGQELVTAGAFKLRNGAKVTVNNTTKPEPQLEPHPDNR